MYFSRENRVTFEKPSGSTYNAINGMNWVLRDGKYRVVPMYTKEERHPRTAAGIDRSGKKLIILVIDGRQPNYSEGAHFSELRDIMLEFGIWTGINLDGGGSTTLAAQGPDGRPEVLNCPIDNRVPGRERPVGNHLGIIAQPVR